ncbi:MAG: Fe-S cluster assembly protein SufD [Proteobacteria bacterium]|nr:Fe-S cluster assembly protein SufD [Pseudomonadota bacterium]
MTKQTDHYQNEFSSVWSELPGYKISWLDRLRLKAISEFTSEGFPSIKSEDWKYTDLTPVREARFQTRHVPSHDIPQERIDTLLKELEGAITIVFVDGIFHQVTHNAETQGLTLSSFKNAVDQRLVQVKDYLVSYPQTVSAFESLNTAFMNDGVYLSLEAGRVLQEPIQLLSISSGKNQHLSVHSRNLLVFGENSRAAVVERYISLSEDKEYLTNTVTQTVLNAGATVEYTKIQEESDSAFHFLVNRASLAENSNLTIHTQDFGGRLTRYNLTVELNGPNAMCRVNGLFLVDGERQADNYLLMEHKVPDCRSESLFRGVLDDKSKGVFRGRIKVHQDAQHTNAQLNNANMLLSNNAEVDTMPQLEIYADDVKCNHGSSSGKLDEDQLFYLTSRGMDREAAHNLLVYAFANTVIEKIESEDVQKLVETILLNKLASNGDLKELLQ